MNRHDLVMSTEKIPESVNMENIKRIFVEYEKDAKNEKKSRMGVVLPEEPGQSVYECNTLDAFKEVTQREFLSTNSFNSFVDFPYSYFEKKTLNSDNFFSECTLNIEVGENQAGEIHHSQPVAA